MRKVASQYSSTYVETIILISLLVFSKSWFLCHFLSSFGENLPPPVLKRTFYTHMPRMLKHSRPMFGRFVTGRIFYRLEYGKNPQMKKSKNANFQNHLKIDPEGFRYRFRVQNASRTPQVSISGHISCTRTLPADESKDEFLTKIAIFMNFNCDQMWPIFCRKALET